MKRFLTLLFLVAVHFPLLSWAVTKNKSVSETNFSKGVDTYHNPQSLPEGYVQDSLNVLFDNQTPVQKRQGYTVGWSTKSYQYTGLWTYTDGTNTTWQLARSSDQITASNLAGMVVKVATVSVSNLVGETNAFGFAFFVDQTNGVYYWNGSSTTYEGGSPLGSIITTFHGRVWVTGLTVPNGNQLYGSSYNDALSANAWNTAQAGLPVTEAVQYPIGLNDNFDNTTAEYVYLDTLYIFKHSSIYALYGFDQSNFQISQLTQECGCIDGGSIQTYNGAMEFASLRGIEAFNGYTCRRISDAVKNKVDPAISVEGYSQQSWLQSSQTDWNNGTLFQTNANIAPPALVLSTGTVTENSPTQWSSGTYSGVTINSNSLVISTNNAGSVNNPGFESCNFSAGTCPNWTFSNSIFSVLTFTNCNPSSPHGGSFDIGTGGGSNTNYYFDITDTNSNILNSTTLSPSCPWSQVTINDSSDMGKRVQFRIRETGNGCSPCLFSSNESYIFSGSISLFIAGSGNVLYFDDVTNGSSTITSGNFTSKIYDTTISSPVFTLSFSSSSNTEAISIGVNTSTSPTGPFASFGSLSGQANRYLQMTATFTLTGSDNAGLSSINSDSFQWTASSGTIKSQIHNFGSINSFGNFAITDALNGGNIAFSICSSTMSTMTPPSACANQTANTPITISTGTGGSGTYIQWYSTFTVTASTQTPTLNTVAVQAFSGTRQVPMASTVWDNRYWLSLTTNTADAANDSVLVLNQSGAWAPLDIHAGAFTQYKNNLYHASSRADGNIYLDNQGEADNGNPINAYVRTRAFSFGELAADDYLYALYPSAVNTGNCSMTMSYELDQTGAFYPLSTVNLNEFNSYSAVRNPFPITSSNQDFGQTFDLLVGTDDGVCDWQFYGLDMLYKARPIF